MQRETGGSFLPTQTKGWETLGDEHGLFDAEEGGARCPHPATPLTAGTQWLRGGDAGDCTPAPLQRWLCLRQPRVSAGRRAAARTQGREWAGQRLQRLFGGAEARQGGGEGLQL